MPARAPLVQLSKREPVYHKVIMGGASCYFCHIPLAGGNKPKFCSLSSLFQGVSTKRREPRTRGNSDIHKLLQHTSSGHHHIQLRCLPSTDLAEEVHQSRAGASPGFLLWPNACTINHQALLFCLLDASLSHSFLHGGAAAAPACLHFLVSITSHSYTVAMKITVYLHVMITMYLYILHFKLVSQGS